MTCLAFRRVYAKNLIPYAEGARKSGGLAVFMFHGVGGDYLEVTRKQHLTLLQYLNENRADYWIGTFRDVIEHVISEKKRLGWE